MKAPPALDCPCRERPFALFAGPCIRGAHKLLQVGAQLACRCELHDFLYRAFYAHEAGKALDFEETRKYVQHRLEVAGLGENIFDEKAMELLYERSGGIPRWINNIANLSMLAAYSKGEKTITGELVAEGVESSR